MLISSRVAAVACPVLLLLLSACQRREAAPLKPVATTTTPRVAVPAAPPGTKEAETGFVRPNYFDAMLVGAPSGAEAVLPKNEFATGETMRTAVKLRMSPAGLAATLEAQNAKNQITYRERKMLADGAKNVTFEWKVGRDWKNGEYTLHLKLGADEYAQQRVFVGQKAPAPGTPKKS